MKFNAKTFNPNAFAAYMTRVPQPKKNELIKSKALKGNSQIKEVFRGQTGTFYATIPMFGLIDGAPVNYDGATDIIGETSTTFERGVIVIGRAKGFTESDFSEDITAGAGFMDNVANQLGAYWDGVDQETLLAILKGLFAMQDPKFTGEHTHDISALVEGIVGASTLNTAVQKASGDKKSKFSLVFMHSVIATGLENLKLLAYMTYTDAKGIERQLDLASWNGRIVLIDDGMPTEAVKGHHIRCAATDAGALKVVPDNKPELAPGEIKVKDTGIAGITAGEFVLFLKDYTRYTTYLLGEGAFDYEDLGAEVPYAMVRDEKTNGGQTTLYTRKRKCFAPRGISFKKASVASLSPTNQELSNGVNWEVVHDGGAEGARKYYDYKAIPIARILSRG